MRTSRGISFDAPPLVFAFGLIAMVVVAALAFYAWRRSGNRADVGVLESLRMLIATMALITLFQPEWKEVYQPNQRPVLAVLKDVSSSMQTRDVVDVGSSANSGQPDTRQQRLDRQVANVAWETLADRVEVVQQEFGSSEPTADVASATNLDSALEAARKRHANLRAAVLLSDGDWNQGESPANAATRYRIHQIPIYTMTLGSEEALPDIEVVSLEPPTFSVVGKSMQIPFTVRSTMATDYEAEVELTVGDGQRLTKVVVVPAMGQVRELFFWTPEEIGDVALELAVPAHPDERLLENNAAAVKVAVKEESLKVLIVEATPRWEYRYLRNALERDPGVDVACLMFHPGLSKRGGGPGYLEAFPQTDEALSEYDVVFLGDVGVSSDQLSVEDCERIKGIVENQASGLILMPGMRGHQYGLLETPLAEIYPVVLDETSRRGFGSKLASSPVLTDFGRTSLLTKLADTVQENTAVWKSLPGFQWRSPAVRARAGCEVLALDEQSRAPLLVTKTFGTGKVLFMGTDSAWRWREGVEDKYHYRFWGQVARWMAYQRHMAEGDMLRVFYTPDRPTAGNTITLNATALDATGAPLSDATVTAKLWSPNGATRQLRFASTGNDWGLYVAKFTPEQTGAYKLDVSCKETSATLETTINVQGKQREVIGKPARYDVMRELAEITRGEIIGQDELDRLCDLVLQLPPPEPMVRRKQIWASPYWAGTLIVAMGVFWIGRKWVGSI